MFMCFRYMNEIRINIKIPGLTDTRNQPRDSVYYLPSYVFTGFQAFVLPQSL